MFDFGFGGSGLFRFLLRLFRWFHSGGFVPVVSGFSTCRLGFLKNSGWTFSTVSRKCEMAMSIFSRLSLFTHRL